MQATDVQMIADRWMLESRRLINWGSYEGYHEFRPSTDHKLPVTLLAGASESGKSTLVDAQISLLYPTGTPFNKASNSGRSERSDYTYLRGMVGVGSTETGDEPLYLRGRDENGAPQPVWGAIVDTYRNQTTGQVLSCAKFLYLMPGDGRGDVRRQYVVWGKPVDPRRMDQYRDAPFTPAQLKATYPDCLTFPSAEAFHTHIWSAMGLSEAACRLLHKIRVRRRALPARRHLQTRRARRARSPGPGPHHGRGLRTLRRELPRHGREDPPHGHAARHPTGLRRIRRRTRQGPRLRTGQAGRRRHGAGRAARLGIGPHARRSRRPTARRSRRTTEQRGGSQAAAPPNRRPAHPSRHDPRPDAGSGRRRPDPTRTRTRPGPPHPRRRASQPNTNQTNVRIHRRDAARRRTGLERTPHQRRELQTRIQQTRRRMRGSPHRRHQRAGRRTRRPRTTATRLRPATLPAHPHLPADGRNPRHALPRHRTHPQPNCRTWPNSWT